MKKILYIVTQSEFAGAQRYVHNLATSLNSAPAKAITNHSWEIHVAAGGSGELFDRLKGTSVITHRLKYLHRPINPLYDYFAYQEIAQLYQDIQPAIVHLNSSKAGLLGAFAARQCAVPHSIYTAHGFVVNEKHNPLVLLAYKYLELSYARVVDHIITVSRKDFETGKRIGIPAKKMTVIHNGLNSEMLQFLPKEKAKEALSKKLNRALTEKKIIGCIANFYYNKGLDVLIKAMRNNKEALVVIIGEGGQRTALERMIKKYGLEDRVLLAGSLSAAHQYLKAFDLFVLPSRKEGFPYVLLEAGIAGIPIVATKVGGIPEIIHHGINGYLSAPDDHESLSRTIQKALHKVRRPLLDHFTFDKMLARTVQIYRTLENQ